MRLTDGELEVAMLVRCGRSNGEIARLQGCSVGAVRCLLNRLYFKLGFRGMSNPRVRLAVWFVEHYQKLGDGG